MDREELVKIVQEEYEHLTAHQFPTLAYRVADRILAELQTESTHNSAQLQSAQAKIQELEAELLITRRQREEGEERIKSLAILMEDTFNGQDISWKEKANWLRDCVHQLLSGQKEKEAV